MLCHPSHHSSLPFSPLTHSSLPFSSNTHTTGKLLFDPNLEDDAYATNAGRGGLVKLSLSTRKVTQTIPFLPAAGSDFKCNKTHGISYSATDDSIYVECSSFVCKVAGDKTCTGSIWKMKVSDSSTTRLSSPALSAKYNSDQYGIAGQPYRSPEGTFIFVPNSKHNMIHILKPMADGTTLIREVAVASPGYIAFRPKVSTMTYGLDANPENYVMAVNGLLGVYLLDLTVVVAAFATTSGTISESAVDLIPVTTTGGFRTMRRGHDYVTLGTYTTDATTDNKETATGIAIVNIVTKTVKYHAIKLFTSAVWVPIQSTENTAMIKSLQSKVALISASSASSSSSDDSKSSSLLTNNALIVAAIAFVMSLISLILIVALGVIMRRNKRAEGNLL